MAGDVDSDGCSRLVVDVARNRPRRPLVQPSLVNHSDAAAEGLSNREVSEQLGLSEHTIRNYLFRVFDKLGVSTRVELVLYCLQERQAKTAENGGEK